MYNLYLQIKLALAEELQGWHFNGAGGWLSVLIVFLAVFIFLRGTRKIVLYICTKLENPEVLDGWEIVKDLVTYMNYFFSISFAIYLGTLMIELPELVEKVLSRVFVLIMVVYLVLMLRKVLVDVFKVASQIGKKDNAIDKTAVTFFRVIMEIVLWIAAVIIILQSWGYNVSVLLGGLGIVGIIVGLAFQNAMKDILAFFSIYQDRTFKVGDYITTPDLSGTVREIGMRSTRLKATAGHNIVIANQKLVDGVVENYGRLKERTVVRKIRFDPVISYTQLEKLEELIRDAFTKDEDLKEVAELKRAYFDEITDRGFSFEIVYTVRDVDYETYTQIKQRVNLALVKRFRQEKIKMDDTGLLDVNARDVR